MKSFLLNTFHRLPPGFRKISGNLGWLYLDQLVRLVLGTVVIAWMARALGPGQFGVYSFVLTVVTTLTAIAGLAIDPVIVRDLARAHQDPKAVSENCVLGSAFFLRACAAAISVAVVVLLVALVMPNDHTALTTSMVMALSIFAQPFLLIDFWFRARYLARYTVIARMVSAIGSNLLRITLILLHAPLIAYAIPLVLDFATLAGGLIVLYGRQGQDISNWGPTVIEIKRLARLGLPLLFTTAMVLIQARADVIMIAKYLPPEQLGYYSVALRLTELAATVPSLLLTALEPFAARQAARGHTALSSAMRTIYRLNVILCLIPILPMLFTPGLLIHILFGHRYDPATPLLVLSVGRLFLASIGITKSLFLINRNIYWRSAINSVVGVVLSIGLNVWLIPHYGAYGAIYSSFISFFCTIVLMDLFWIDLRENIKNMLIGTLTPFAFRIHDLEHG